MFTLAIFEGFLGYPMPDDLLSGTGVRIAEAVLLGIPVVGTYLSFSLFGGQFPGDEFVTRFDIIHVLLIPGLLLALVSAHLLFVVIHKHTQMPGPGRTNDNVVGQPIYPIFGGADRRVLHHRVRRAGPAGRLRPDQPHLAGRPLHPDGHLGRFAAGLLYGLPGRLAADVPQLDLGPWRPHHRPTMSASGRATPRPGPRSG